MRKLSLMLVLIFCLMLAQQKDSFDDIVFAFGSESEYEIYFVGSIVDELPSGATYVRNGAGTIIVGTINQVSQIKQCIVGDIYGETIKIAGVYEDVDDVVDTLGIDIVKTDDFDEIRCVYGNIDGLEEYVTINGKQVNVQVAYSNGTISIGYPLIVGAY